MRATVIFAALALSACGRTIVEDRPVTVKVPVTVPCVIQRPAQVVPLRDKTPDWDSLDVRQKSALVGKQGLERQAYGERLNAATAGCN